MIVSAHGGPAVSVLPPVANCQWSDFKPLVVRFVGDETSRQAPLREGPLTFVHSARVSSPSVPLREGSGRHSARARSSSAPLREGPLTSVPLQESSRDQKPTPRGFAHPRPPKPDVHEGIGTAGMTAVATRWCPALAAVVPRSDPGSPTRVLPLFAAPGCHSSPTYGLPDPGCDPRAATAWPDACQPVCDHEARYGSAACVSRTRRRLRSHRRAAPDRSPARDLRSEPLRSTARVGLHDCTPR